MLRAREDITAELLSHDFPIIESIFAENNYQLFTQSWEVALENIWR